MDYKATIKLEDGKGISMTYPLTITSEATKNAKTGKVSFMQLQPAPENKVLQPFSKVYVNIAELAGALKTPKGK